MTACCSYLLETFNKTSPTQRRNKSEQKGLGLLMLRKKWAAPLYQVDHEQYKLEIKNYGLLSGHSNNNVQSWRVFANLLAKLCQHVSSKSVS